MARTPIDVAHAAVIGLTFAVIGLIIILGVGVIAGAEISDTAKVTITAALGTLGSIGSGAVGYRAGQREDNVREDPPTDP